MNVGEAITILNEKTKAGHARGWELRAGLQGYNEGPEVVYQVRVTLPVRKTKTPGWHLRNQWSTYTPPYLSAEGALLDAAHIVLEYYKRNADD